MNCEANERCGVRMKRTRAGKTDVKGSAASIVASKQFLPLSAERGWACLDERKTGQPVGLSSELA